jgi:hypothetical protein
MAIRAFDLNVEEVLENWEVEHAIREVIANALDEQVLSDTVDIRITRDQADTWHVVDSGRGLRIEHFTLNENPEKLAAPSGVIGKFGVGLKDALATFHRRGVDVLVRSQFGTFRTKTAHKHGFDEILTLHVEYDDTPTNLTGTEFVLHDVSEETMKKAMSLFLWFSGDEILETTAYGQILRRRSDAGRIYVHGVLVSVETNFLFSYNITSLTPSMKKQLNRERINVGRTTYAERVKGILKGALNPAVHDLIVEQVTKRATGEQCDEMAWIEISQMALNLLHQRQGVAYFTEQQVQDRPNLVDAARRDGYQIVVITEQQKVKLEAQAETGGAVVRTLDNYVREFNASFEYKFVDAGTLTRTESRVFEMTPAILALVGKTPATVPPIRISETMRITIDDTEGVWDPAIQAIVIKRSKLESITEYAATLLHEVAHATTGAVDVSRQFENVLTDYLGRTAVAAIGKRVAGSI